MPVDLKITSDSGRIIFADASLQLAPPPIDDKNYVEYFRNLTPGGRVFILESEHDDDLQLRVRIASDDDLGMLPSYRVPQPSGSYLLHLPTGALVASDGEPLGQAHRVELAAGYYSVAVRNLSEEQLIASLYQAEERALLGETDWAYYQRLDRFSLIGCLPIVALPVLLLIFKWSWISFAAILVSALLLATNHVLRKSKRMRDIQARRDQLDEQYPHVLLTLIAAPSPEGLTGGRVTI